ncbi:MAG: ATP-binding protein [Syntrophobacteraceae bacterium]|nr:two-component sensor histidine kinase [Desulfobacteraceae bacterium]
MAEEIQHGAAAEDGHLAEMQRSGHYRRLFRRFVFLSLFCSLVPLLLVGWGMNIHYTDFARSRMLVEFREDVAYHQKIIEMFLKEMCSKLQIVAGTHSMEFLSNPANLNEVFELMNKNELTITDIGVIDHTGHHLAYIGPYDLMDKDYSRTFWFPQVMEKGLYISDMFMGYRVEPHFIIAVASTSPGGQKWILRATVNTDAFRSLVENVQIGETGEVYLLNQEGVYQTTPRFSGHIMEKSPFPVDPNQTGIQVKLIEPEDENGRKGQKQVVSSTWLRDPHWLLVVKQDYAEAFYAVNHANYAVLIFLHLSALTILAVSVLISRHMVRLIKKQDMEADNLNRQLTQTSKMASIGELSAGVAHEINNPLAVILTELQIVMDAMNDTPELDKGFSAQLDDSINQIIVQIQRCKHITTNLLRFSRRTRPIIEDVQLNEFIEEVIELMEREAKSCGIRFFAELDENLPLMLTDPSQLQQVFLNMITNAIDAHDGKGYGSVTIRTRFKGTAGDPNPKVLVEIMDTGNGIPPENLDKIFDPFFTTKPVGRGTGLGLSICFSIIKRLGGEISVRSQVGEKTEFSISFPLHPPAELLEQMHKEQ